MDYVYIVCYGTATEHVVSQVFASQERAESEVYAMNEANALYMKEEKQVTAAFYFIVKSKVYC